MMESPNFDPMKSQSTTAMFIESLRGPVMESSLRDAPHWYLRSTQYAFDIGGIAFGGIAIKELLEGEIAFGLVLTGLGVASSLIGAVHSKLNDMKYALERPERI